jgi:hypothetical protein
MAAVVVLELCPYRESVEGRHQAMRLWDGLRRDMARSQQRICLYPRLLAAQHCFQGPGKLLVNCVVG